MQSNKSKDTKPELRIRHAVHALGARYHVDAKPLPKLRRRADLVFTRAHIAVFVDGCFWHGCPEHHTVSKTNPGFWADKVEGNRRRDAETNRLLADAGWKVIRVWEHDDVETAALRIYNDWAAATGRPSRSPSSTA